MNVEPGPQPESAPESQPEPQPEPDEPPAHDSADAGRRIAAMVAEEAERAEAEPETSPEAKRGETIPPFDPYTITCPDCQGFGVTETGSRVEDHLYRPCVTCQGRGWMEKDLLRPPQPPPQPPPNAAEQGDARLDSVPSASWRW